MILTFLYLYLPHPAEYTGQSLCVGKGDCPETAWVDCDNYDRSFGSQQALIQHLNSPAHAPVDECDECDRSFSSQQALD